jgi:hypothetical protein
MPSTACARVRVKSRIHRLCSAVMLSFCEKISARWANSSRTVGARAAGRPSLSLRRPKAGSHRLIGWSRLSLDFSARAITHMAATGFEHEPRQKSVLSSTAAREPGDLAPKFFRTCKPVSSPRANWAPTMAPSRTKRSRTAVSGSAASPIRVARVGAGLACLLCARPRALVARYGGFKKIWCGQRSLNR